MSELQLIKQLIRERQDITIEDITFPARKVSDPKNGTLKTFESYKIKNVVVIRYQYGKQAITRYITLPWSMLRDIKSYINIEIRKINIQHNQKKSLL